ncbi:hypothetical protein OSTOST_25348 [Ostertagia ostertagi]
MALSAFLSSQNTELADEIARNLYVDNILLQAESPEEAVQKYYKSKQLFARIGMNLREYISSSKEVNQRIPKEDRLESNCLKVLGVEYKLENDAFQVTTNFRNAVNGAIISLPRPFNPGAKIRLWAFADASNAAIATCAYGQNVLSRSISSLISGKTRLTPRKCHQTIPRLELIGLLMAMRLTNSIVSNVGKSHITVDSISVVTDSEIALWWLKSTKKLPLFVANTRERILKIKTAIEAKGISLSFFHVITSHNPADAGTRGLSAQNINNSDWVRGPKWLEANPATWPIKSIEYITETPSESDDNQVTPKINILAQTSENSPQLIDLTRFSTLPKVHRVVAIVNKTLSNWASLTNKNRSTKIELLNVSKFSSAKEISSTEIELAERIVLLQEQRHEDIKTLQKRFTDKNLIRDENGLIQASIAFTKRSDSSRYQIAYLCSYKIRSSFA